MANNSIIEPKQKRSLDTQQKLLAALNQALQNKFFEHISIKELAESADVSVGTFYRRFKNKESLLPLLYQDFGNDLDSWVGMLETHKFATIEELVRFLCLEMCTFLMQKKSVFRTLHLNARLYSTVVLTDESVDRRVIYQRLSAIILQFEQDFIAEDKQSKADAAIFTLISALLDKVLYPDLTPAIACKLTAEQYADELASMILSYLVNT